MSRELAERVASEKNVFRPIVMATIEAETNFRNVLGQYAAWSARFGIGFGQVHLRWHFDALQTVARDLNITLPSQVNPMHDDAANEPFRRLILGNDMLSMHLAIEVIRRAWRGVNGDWDRFTERYVGAGISSRDRERRRVIWRRWLTHFGHTYRAGYRYPVYDVAPVTPPAPVPRIPTPPIAERPARVTPVLAGSTFIENFFAIGALFVIAVAILGFFRRILGLSRA